MRSRWSTYSQCWSEPMAIRPRRPGCWGSGPPPYTESCATAAKPVKANSGWRSTLLMKMLAGRGGRLMNALDVVNELHVGRHVGPARFEVFIHGLASLTNAFEPLPESGFHATVQ